MEELDRILKELEVLGRELDVMQTEMTGMLVNRITEMEKFMVLASSTTREDEIIMEREIQRVRLRRRQPIQQGQF
jgi:hypothetical protein